MKRFLLGAGWFVVLWMGTIMLGGFVIGAANAGHPEQAARAGAAFGHHYNGLVMLVALIVSAVGTATGRLPGTAPEAPVSQA